MWPRLPTTARLRPYLEKIDQSRIYTNFGPLAVAFEERLAAHFSLPPRTVLTVANCTLGLTLALLAQRAAPGTLCVVPAWTFVATAQAAVLAGLVPYFVDVDPATGALDTTSLSSLIRDAPNQVGAVMPVAPFGQPLEIRAWDHFRSRTGVPVVIDAAAGFDSLQPGDTPAVVSLHATKALGAGEGGFVVSTDPALIWEIRARSNFGFAGTREAVVMAANAKFSEYHAAVAHAALDEWANARSEWFACAGAYRRALRAKMGFELQRGFGEAWVASTCVVKVPNDGAEYVERELWRRHIMTRRWWGDGAHAHAATLHYPRAHLQATEALAKATIGLPFYRDATSAEIDQVCGGLEAAIGACDRKPDVIGPC
jgi:dTDP-4-amino-4,6-dideoxygalactose transaminase